MTGGAPWTSDEHASFRRAVHWALMLHEAQVRKRSGVPFAGHLLAVASTVIDHGGSAEAAIAALLHDAIEDQGGDATALEIESKFGARVRALVEHCTDARTEPKPPWRPRKEAYLQNLSTSARESLLITAADKLHNMRSLTRELLTCGPACWESFSSGREGAMWYFRSVIDALKQRTDAMLPVLLVDELETAFAEFVTATERG